MTDKNNRFVQHFEARMALKNSLGSLSPKNRVVVGRTASLNCHVALDMDLGHQNWWWLKDWRDLPLEMAKQAD